MDRIADWRPIEAAAPTGAAAEQAIAAADRHRHWRLLALAALACVAVGAVALALWAGSPQPQLVLGAVTETLPPPASAPSASVPALAIVVDVEGAVVVPGLYELPQGSRVGDAIAAAGGYGPGADVEAAAQLLNLAARLADGDKILVPRLGGQPPIAASPAASSPNGGLIDINTADQAALETLPGIGPATAAKIIAARNEAPFASVDELLSRGVLGTATFDKVRPLVTVGQ